MPPPRTVPARTKTDRAPSPEAALLEALAGAGEALTCAIVEHDLDSIVAATREAELLMARLTTGGAVRLAAAADGGGRTFPDAPDPSVLLLGARIGATARRNALLLEHAWATDAALLRLLATAARAGAEAASGTGYAQPTPDAQPAGWLDRSA
jgi:hypothetical protein